MAGHPGARRLQSEEREISHQLIQGGVAPKHVLNILQQRNPESHVITKTIYNEHTHLKAHQLQE